MPKRRFWLAGRLDLRHSQTLVKMPDVITELFGSSERVSSTSPPPAGTLRTAGGGVVVRRLARTPTRPHTHIPLLQRCTFKDLRRCRLAKLQMCDLILISSLRRLLSAKELFFLSLTDFPLASNCCFLPTCVVIFRVRSAFRDSRLTRRH